MIPYRDRALEERERRRTLKTLIFMMLGWMLASCVHIPRSTTWTGGEVAYTSCVGRDGNGNCVQYAAGEITGDRLPEVTRAVGEAEATVVHAHNERAKVAGSERRADQFANLRVGAAELLIRDHAACTDPRRSAADREDCDPSFVAAIASGAVGAAPPNSDAEWTARGRAAVMGYHATGRRPRRGELEARVARVEALQRATGTALQRHGLEGEGGAR